MQQTHRMNGILVGAGLSALLTVLSVIWSLHMPTTSARASQLLSPKPVNGWYVCLDLGIGSIPGVPEPRQRLQLCHDEGWAVNTYCTQPGFPPPPLGRSCTRIGEEKYSCGANYQLLREYHTLETPVNTPTSIVTPTQTSTPSPTTTESLTSSPPPSATETPTITTPPPATATETPTPRVPTGGEGNAAQVRTLVFTEISIFILAICAGIWFFRRLEIWG